jgi:hypothetical protein
MTCSRSAAELALLAFALGAVSLTYGFGAFVMGLAFHPPSGHGWRTIEVVAVGAYAVGWLGLLLGAGELWTRWERRRGKARP